MVTVIDEGLIRPTSFQAAESTVKRIARATLGYLDRRLIIGHATGSLPFKTQHDRVLLWTGEYNPSQANFYFYRSLNQDIFQVIKLHVTRYGQGWAAYGPQYHFYTDDGVLQVDRCKFGITHDGSVERGFEANPEKLFADLVPQSVLEQLRSEVPSANASITPLFASQLMLEDDGQPKKITGD